MPWKSSSVMDEKVRFVAERLEGRESMTVLDEVPVAFVIPVDAGDDGLPGRVLEACAATLASFKRPHEVRLVNSLPRSTLEKIAKAELRAVLAAES